MGCNCHLKNVLQTHMKWHTFVLFCLTSFILKKDHQKKTKKLEFTGNYNIAVECVRCGARLIFTHSFFIAFVFQLTNFLNVRQF
jgi:hypothetical protein